MSGESVTACRTRVRREASDKKKQLLLDRDRAMSLASTEYKKAIDAARDADARARKVANDTYKSEATDVDSWLMDALVGCQK